MSIAPETAGLLHSSLTDLLATCPMHVEEASPHERLEVSGRVERLAVEGRFVVLVPRARDSAVTTLELDVADIESCEVLFEDSAKRKTCRLVVAAGATIRKRCTATELRRELDPATADEDTSRTHGTSDPMTAWETAAWRNSVPEEQSPRFAQSATSEQQRSEPATSMAPQQPYPAAAGQIAYIELYEGQLYYYFPNGLPSRRGLTP